MADITATLLLADGDDTDRTVYTTASINPAADRLILCLVMAADQGFSSVVHVDSVAGAGLTWVEDQDLNFDTIASERRCLAVYRALGASPSAGALTITLDSPGTACRWMIVEFDNVDIGGTNGSSAIVQNKTNRADSGTSIVATLDAFEDVNNATVGCFGSGSVNTTLTEGSGFTKVAEVDLGTIKAMLTFRADNDITVDMSQSVDGDMAVIALELRNAHPKVPEPAADVLTITDSGEFAATLPFTEIDAVADLFSLTDTPETTFARGAVSTTKTLIIAEIKLTGGTLYRAGKGIRHPSRMYVGKVKSFGSIIRSIQVPSGLPQIGDAELTIVDTDGELRDLMSSTPPQNREIVLKIGSEGASEAVFQTAYVGIITHATFPPGLAKVRIQDNTFKFLGEQLPNLLTRENFTADPLFAKNLRARTEGRFDEAEIFSPIVFGVLDSTGLDVIGSMNAVRLDSTTFNLAQHSIPHDPITIFTKFPGDDGFIEQTGGFSIVEVSKTIEDIDYTFTHIVFGAAQDDGTEVRWDGEGMTDDDTKDGTVIRNPAEAIKQYLIRIARRSPTELDLIGIDAQAASLVDFCCDGAIAQRMTHREALARMTRSFGILLFTNKKGLITLRYINASNADRIVLDDVQDIYRRSEVHSLARPIVNEVNLQYTRMLSEQSWQGLLTITDDESVESLQRTESKDLKLFFVRDDIQADRVARDYLQFTNPGSFRIVLTIPGHRRTADVELGDLIGITNYSGLDASGYLNKEFLVHKTEFLTDTKQLRVHGVARVSFSERTESQASEWVTITAGSGSGVEGGYEELIDATDDLGTWVLVQVRAAPPFQAALFEEFDLAIGSLGNEVNFVDDAMIVSQADGAGNGAALEQDFSFPFRITSGSRISARTKGTSLRSYQIIVHVNG